MQDDLDVNFYDFKARGYDPAIGRFMQIDELSIIQTSWTPYHYNANNPVRFIDPTGLIPEDTSLDDFLQDLFNKTPNDGLAHHYDTDGNQTGTSDPGKKKKKKKGVKESDTIEPLEWDNTAITAALATSAVLLVDDVTGVGVIDDIAIPFIIIGGTAIHLYDNAELMAKQLKEVNRILEKKLGPQGFAYALLVNRPGTYIDVRGNPVVLKAGDVWKYGETTRGIKRYSQSKLASMVPGGVSLLPLFFGNQVQIKVEEKVLIYGHAIRKGSLPPGNKIFR